MRALFKYLYLFTKSLYITPIYAAYIKPVLYICTITSFQFYIQKWKPEIWFIMIIALVIITWEIQKKVCHMLKKYTSSVCDRFFIPFFFHDTHMLHNVTHFNFTLPEL